MALDGSGIDIAGICAEIKTRVGPSPVLLLVSGGVDSTVTAALLLKALGSSQLHLMYMDTGLMRKNETAQVKTMLEKLGAEHLYIVDCEKDFLAALKGIEDPEAKRRAVGDMFITVQEREVKALNLPSSYFLAQGTICPDVIESSTENKAHLIKSHHNVGTPLVEAKRREERLVEPLEKLYKDDVRSLGKLLGIGEEILRRHPFPGPGLAVRVIGEVTKEKCDLLREADAIYIEELKRRKTPAGNTLYDDIWQAFAILLPVCSTGIAENSRRYSRVLVLRAITSVDGMTAEVYPFAYKDLNEISSRIIGSIKEISRVTYDVSGKPPATIEWE